MGDARLEQWLDALDRCRTSPAPKPPDAFLAALGRRRRNRLIAHAAQAMAGVAAVALFVAVLTSGRPLRHAPLARRSDPTAVPGIHATAEIPATSLIALTRANPSLDAERVVLPDPAASVPAAGAGVPNRRIPLSGIWTADQVDRWLSGN